MVFLVIIFVVYSLVFLGKPVIVGSTPVVDLSKANIDFSIFNSAQFKQLKVFGELNVQGGQTGRDNPFVPYYQAIPALSPIITNK